MNAEPAAKLPGLPAPFVAKVDGIADLIARWRAEGKINVEEGSAKITL